MVILKKDPLADLTEKNRLGTIFSQEIKALVDQILVLLLQLKTETLFHQIHFQILIQIQTLLIKIKIHFQVQIPIKIKIPFQANQNLLSNKTKIHFHDQILLTTLDQKKMFLNLHFKQMSSAKLKKIFSANNKMPVSNKIALKFSNPQILSKAKRLSLHPQATTIF